MRPTCDQSCCVQRVAMSETLLGDEPHGHDGQSSLRSHKRDEWGGGESESFRIRQGSSPPKKRHSLHQASHPPGGRRYLGQLPPQVVKVELRSWHGLQHRDRRKNKKVSQSGQHQHCAAKQNKHKKKKKKKKNFGNDTAPRKRAHQRDTMRKYGCHCCHCLAWSQDGETATGGTHMNTQPSNLMLCCGLSFCLFFGCS